MAGNQSWSTRSLPPSVSDGSVGFPSPSDGVHDEEVRGLILLRVANFPVGELNGQCFTGGALYFDVARVGRVADEQVIRRDAADVFHLVAECREVRDSALDCVSFDGGAEPRIAEVAGVAGVAPGSGCGPGRWCLPGWPGAADAWCRHGPNPGTPVFRRRRTPSCRWPSRGRPDRSATARQRRHSGPPVMGSGCRRRLMSRSGRAALLDDSDTAATHPRTDDPDHDLLRVVRADSRSDRGQPGCSAGQPADRYWVAFGASLVGSVIAYAGIGLLAIIAGAASNVG